jgi:transposase
MVRPIQCEIEIPEPAANLGPAVGIDIGVAKPLVLSTGEVVQLPRTTGKGRHKPATLQRRLAWKTKGSRNQARARVARFQARLARRRKDAAHGVTTIARNQGLIVVESLRMRNMTASGRYRPMRSFQAHTSAFRFCQAHDEVRDLLRPATRRKEPVPAARRQAIHVQKEQRTRCSPRDMLAAG